MHVALNQVSSNFKICQILKDF